MKRNKLLIVSHTEHFQTSDGKLVGWGPTVNEVNFMADYWEEVVHIGCLHQKAAPESALPYRHSNIRFVPISPYGGKSVFEKLKILFKIPKIIRMVIKNLDEASEVQLRLPTAMGIFLLPLFAFCLQRKYTLWVKYAGNWNQKNPPLSYGLQRWFLKKNFARCKVTINGFWPDQPAHCYSFENPSLTEDHIANGKQIAAQKVFFPPFTLAFVGRLEDAKGVSRIIEALKNIPVEKIEKVHFIGSGDDLEKYKNASRFLGEKVLFHGFQNSEKVHQLLAESHFLLLPSASEGFPKVIAEAACYGCIPIVSNVGSIPHYISEEEGFVWPFKNDGSYAEVVREAVQSSPDSLAAQSQSILALAEKFTYASYYKKLVNQVFKS